MEIWETTNVEVRSPKSEVRSAKSEVRSPKSEVRSRKFEVRSRKFEVGSSKSEVRSSKSEVRSPKFEVRSANETRPDDGPLAEGFPRAGKANRNRALIQSTAFSAKRPILAAAPPSPFSPFPSPPPFPSCMAQRCRLAFAALLSGVPAQSTQRARFKASDFKGW